MRQLRTVFVLALGSLALPGCFLFDDDYDDYYYDPGEPVASTDGSLTVEASAQSGDMGEIRAYAGDAVASQASYYGTSTSLRLDSLGDNWWVMSYVNIYNLDIVNAPAGTYTYTSATSDGTTPEVSVMGCSGPEYNNYTFDQTTSDAEVTIVDNADGTRTLEWRARFEDYAGGSQLAEGTIVYRQGTGTVDGTGDVAPPPSTDLPTTPDTPSAPATITAIEASQEGAMGDVATFSGSATIVEASFQGTTSSLRLESTGEGWWVMSSIDIGGLDLASAPAGGYSFDAATYDGTTPELRVTGISGPSAGDYTFNAGAQQAEMEITDNADGTRTLAVTAHFTAYDGTAQTASASVRYAVVSAEL